MLLLRLIEGLAARLVEQWALLSPLLLFLASDLTPQDHKSECLGPALYY
jgi:hypothetical protein